jgi:hypothetical protein
MHTISQGYLLNNPGLKTHTLAGCHHRRQLA